MMAETPKLVSSMGRVELDKFFVRGCALKQYVPET
jgi:hypothetical protein